MRPHLLVTAPPTRPRGTVRNERCSIDAVDLQLLRHTVPFSALQCVELAGRFERFAVGFGQ